MDYQIITSQLKKSEKTYQKICDNVELIIEEPATLKEIKQLENHLGIILPIDVNSVLFYQRNFNFQKNEMKYFLPVFSVQ